MLLHFIRYINKLIFTLKWFLERKMSRRNKIATIIAKSLSIPLFSIGMLAVMPTPSHAFFLKFCKIRWEVQYEETGNGIKKKWRSILDPENVQSFNYSASFDPEEFALERIEYLGPYTQTTSPDFSQLSLGLIQGIGGSTSQPAAGNADLFSLILTPLVPNPQSAVSFFAGSGGFIVTMDPDTGNTTTLDPSECPICSEPVPEPITLFGSFLGLGFGAVLKKEYSKKQKKSKL
jgi:hypothetical protein